MEIVFLLVAAGAIVYVLTRPTVDVEQQRRIALAELAEKLKLDFNPDHDVDLASRLFFLNRLRQGGGQYAFNVVSGEFDGYNVLLFDYHYAGHSENRGRVSIQHYFMSVLVLDTGCDLPELTIFPETLGSKVHTALGKADISFESREFSQKFCVRCENRKFAYDVCHAQMIEYLLANPDLHIEIDGPALALTFEPRLSAADLETNLRRLIEIRSRIPNYLFTKS
jgi:hypothetical protein